MNDRADPRMPESDHQIMKDEIDEINERLDGLIKLGRARDERIDDLQRQVDALGRMMKQ